MALALAPRGVLENRKFLRPITNGLIDRSQWLLSSFKFPSSKNTTSLSHWFRQYVMALPKALFGSTCVLCS